MSYKIDEFLNIIIWFLGGFDDLLLSLIIFVIVEGISSILTFLSTYRFSIKATLHWSSSKCVLFLLIGTANTIDSFLIKNGESIRVIILWFYVSYECIIILENARKLGLPIPAKLTEISHGILKHSEKKHSDD